MTEETKNNKENAEDDKGMEGALYNLPQSIDISTASDVLDGIKKVYSKDSDFIIEGSEVGKITTPGVQLILSLATTVEKNNKKFTLKDASENMVAAFEDLGLSKQLNEWKG